MISSNVLISMDYYDAAEKWLTNVIVKSVVEETLNLSIDDKDWQFNWVEYFPVWTIDTRTKSKKVKRIHVKMHDNCIFGEINESNLDTHGLTSYDELLHLFSIVGATRVSGMQTYNSRWNIH